MALLLIVLIGGASGACAARYKRRLTPTQSLAVGAMFGGLMVAAFVLLRADTGMVLAGVAACFGAYALAATGARSARTPAGSRR